MKNKYFPYVVIILLTGLIFWFSNHFLRGNMESMDSLAKELKSDPEEIYLWNLSDEPPFRYRILFPSIIKGLYSLGDSNSSKRFFNVYYFTSMLFMITAVLSFYIFLKKLNFRLNLRIIGTLLFLTAPPVLLAYTLPVHTKEDMLGYTLLLWGLIFIVEEKRWLYLIVAILGVCTRETLLILPFIYFFFSSDKVIYKIPFTILPALVLISIRLAMGQEVYDMWLGLRWNLNNPVQVIAFGFLSFHFLWLASAAELLVSGKDDLSLIKKSAPWAALLILGTTFFFGIFNEMRLIFLLFPWPIVLSLKFLESHAGIFLSILKSNIYKIYVGVLLIGLIGLGYWLVMNIISLMPPSRFSKYYDLWTIVLLFYCYITLCFLPAFYQVMTIHNKSFKYLNDTQK